MTCPRKLSMQRTERQLWLPQLNMKFRTPSEIRFVLPLCGKDFYAIRR